MKFDIDKIVFRPGDVDLSHSPLRKDINVETYVRARSGLQDHTCSQICF